MSERTGEAPPGLAAPNQQDTTAHTEQTKTPTTDTCGHCKVPFRLTLGGLIRVHDNDRGNLCPGSGRWPLVRVEEPWMAPAARVTPAAPEPATESAPTTIARFWGFRRTA